MKRPYLEKREREVCEHTGCIEKIYRNARLPVRRQKTTDKGTKQITGGCCAISTEKEENENEKNGIRIFVYNMAVEEDAISTPARWQNGARKSLQPSEEKGKTTRKRQDKWGKKAHPEGRLGE